MVERIAVLEESLYFFAHSFDAYSVIEFRRRDIQKKVASKQHILSINQAFSSIILIFLEKFKTPVSAIPIMLSKFSFENAKYIFTCALNLLYINLCM